MVDLTLEDGDSSPLPSEVPGLDDAVASWYELEGIEQPKPPEEEPPQPSSSTGSLPFGFSGESNTNVSRLPFGVGSYATGVPFAEDDEVLPMVSEQHRQTSAPAEVAVETPSPISPQTNAVTPPPQVPETLQVHSVPEPVSLPSAVPQTVPQPVFAQPPAPVPQPAPTLTAVPDAAPLASSEPLRVEPAPSLPRIEVVEPQEVRVAAVELMSPPQPSNAPLYEEVPDMWRIDASPVNMEELYATEEQVVEVVHSMDEVEETYMHDTGVEDLHPDSGIISLELHPAKALGVNLNGMPELEEVLAEGFYAIGEESWAQAAISFQKMAAKMPGDSAVFNNYGLALLQRALAMAKSSDLEVQQLSSTQFESAILALREAAKSSPANGTILLNLAHALLVSGRAEKAMNLLFMYQKHNENTPESANLEAATLVSMGESGRALEVLKAVPQDATIASNIAKLTYS
ncbi:MAG: tetratricopeptide repeat protein [Candidatus Poseidoniaceae archaeon]|nr:tetratricopeptide repeat protein [Candidatus Poseidoniaceae archaeon]